jgi:hypothetical protein
MKLYEYCPQINPCQFNAEKVEFFSPNYLQTQLKIKATSKNQLLLGAINLRSSKESVFLQIRE